MALFKMYRGNSSNFKSNELVKDADGNQIYDINGNPEREGFQPDFHEGFCYFIKDTNKLYIDYTNDNNENIRAPLNAGDSDILGGMSFKDWRALIDQKMDKQNPIGEGHFAMNLEKDYYLDGEAYYPMELLLGSSSTTLGTFSAAQGESSLAGGFKSYTTDDAESAVAYGECVEAASAFQAVFGKFNIADDASVYMFILGNGEDDDNRSNAFTVSQEGDAWFQGDVYVQQKDGGTNKDENSLKLATEKYVDSSYFTMRCTFPVGETYEDFYTDLLENRPASLSTCSIRVELDESELFSIRDRFECRKAFTYANFYGAVTDDTTMRIYAYGTTPTIDIPLTVIGIKQE